MTKQGHITGLSSLVIVALLASILLFFSAIFLYKLQRARIQRYLSWIAVLSSKLFCLVWECMAGRLFDLLSKLIPRQLERRMIATVQKLTMVMRNVYPRHVHFHHIGKRAL